MPPYNAMAPACGALTATGAGATWNHYNNARNRISDTSATRDDRPRRPACDRVPRSTGCVYDADTAIAS